MVTACHRHTEENLTESLNILQISKVCDFTDIPLLKNIESVGNFGIKCVSRTNELHNAYYVGMHKLGW